MDTSKEDPERRWVAQGQQSYNPEKDEAVNVSLGHGFLSRKSSTLRRQCCLAPIGIADIIASSSISSNTKPIN